jgi:hypothetical protein
MKKLLTVIALVFMISACDRQTEKVSNSYVLPPELVEKGCEIYVVRGQGPALRAIYCPNAQVTTTYITGKTKTSVSTIN